MQFVLSVVFLAACVSTGYGYKQNITVIGQVICQMHAVPNARVDLREHDRFTFDDSLKVIHTDQDGKFKLYGEHDEITKISPYLRILHNCDVPKTDTKCLRQTDIEIPQDKVGTVWDMHFVNMDIRGHKEKLVCH
uniref:Uncharacterized protein n=1 Tax=Steinernema glaseri TaxID=37863 RepID=A0A1I8AW47_9BILA